MWFVNTYMLAICKSAFCDCCYQARQDKTKADKEAEKGDYYYPCLTVEESPLFSKYGRLRQRYLREHKRVLYFNLLTSGKLYEHLADIDTSACDMAEYLIKEMARKQGVTEQLKAEDMMRWVGLMNNIRACADEIVLNDIVYS